MTAAPASRSSALYPAHFYKPLLRQFTRQNDLDLAEMAWISKSTTALGLILLTHACYSAYEHSALQSHRAASLSSLASTQSESASSLPIDITIETIAATFIICLGLVSGTSQLRPIQWRVWAGKIEREGEAGFKNSSGEVEKDFVGNPFRLLESRPGFVDIRKQRSEFAAWAKEHAIGAS